MERRSDKRGFASMDPERRRRIASEGGRSSRGGRGRGYEDEYDEDYGDEYDEDEDQGVSNRYGDRDYDEYDDEDDYEDTGYGDEDEYEGEGDEDWEDENYDRRGRGRRRISSGRRRTSSRRGFASLDPEEQRRIAHRGGEATARTHGRDFYEEIGGRRGQAVNDEYGPEFQSRIGRRGGQARWEEDEVYGRSSRNREGRVGSGRSGSSSSRRGSYSSSRRSSSGRRGFGAMPREEVRRIARKGARARWEDDYRSRGRSSRGR